MLTFIRDSETQLDNGTYTDCSECPCLNNDMESGSDCNLGYDSIYYKISHNNWKACSSNCLLKKIEFSEKEETNGIMQTIDKIFMPEQFELKGETDHVD